MKRNPHHLRNLPLLATNELPERRDNIKTKKTMTKDTYFKNTFAKFRQVLINKDTLVKLGEPDYTSEYGSTYWYKGEYLYRYSNHWGTVGNCIWQIKGRHNAKNRYKLGVVKFGKIEPIQTVQLVDVINTTIRDRLKVLKHKIPTHRPELHRHLVDCKVRLSFSIESDKYHVIEVSPNFGICCFWAIRIKVKNIPALKLYASKIERLIEPELTKLEMQFGITELEQLIITSTNKTNDYEQQNKVTSINDGHVGNESTYAVCRKRT